VVSPPAGYGTTAKVTMVKLKAIATSARTAATFTTAQRDDQETEYPPSGARHRNGSRHRAEAQQAPTRSHALTGKELARRSSIVDSRRSAADLRKDAPDDGALSRSWSATVLSNTVAARHDAPGVNHRNLDRCLRCAELLAGLLSLIAARVDTEGAWVDLKSRSLRSWLSSTRGAVSRRAKVAMRRYENFQSWRFSAPADR